MATRFGLFAGEEQKVGQVDATVRIVRMMPHRFAEQGSRGLFVSGIEDQRTEIAQHGEVVRLTTDEFEIVALRLLEQAFLTSQAGALEARWNGVRITLQR